MADSDASLTVGYLPTQLGKEDAVAVLNRRGLSFLRRLFRLQATACIDSSRVHLVWMPQYLIDLSIESDKGNAIQQVTLDAWSGVFALWNIKEPLVTGLPDGESFLPRMGVEAGVAKAVLALTNTTLHMRGQKGKPHVTGHDSVQLLYYPYWVYYFERKKGLLDMKIVDGAMGERPGNQVKRGILEAFIDASTAEKPDGLSPNP